MSENTAWKYCVVGNIVKEDKLPGEPFFAGSLNGKPWEQREFRETLTVLFKYGKKSVCQACEN